MDLFDLLSGRGGGRGRERRGEDVVHKLKVGLEELYTGTVRCAHAHTTPCNALMLSCLCERLLSYIDSSVLQRLSHTEKRQPMF